MPDWSSLCSLLGQMIPLEIMQFSFMQKAFIALLLLSPMTAFMGVHVVNFRMSFFSDAVSHSAFAGAALGILFSVDPRWSMILFAVLIGTGIIMVQNRSTLSADTVIGVFFSAAVAFGLAILSRERGTSRQIQSFLFGDLLTLTDQEITLLSGLLLALLIFQALGYNRMLYIGLNSVLAKTHRVKVGLYQYTFAVLLSCVVIFSVWAVGILLVTALLIVPSASARNFCRNARRMFWWSLLISLVSSLSGLLVSAQDWAQISPGSAIIFCACLWFVLSLIKLSVFR